MSNPLDPILKSYSVTIDAIDVVRRTLAGSGAGAATVGGSQFVSLSTADSITLLDAAAETAGEQSVMFLYAAFEATLRAHVVAQGSRLRWVYQPNAQFGVDLQRWYEGLCKHARMDDVAQLFDPLVKPVNPTWKQTMDTVRKYRHWLAHGKRGLIPPTVTPLFAHRFLSEFLTASKLI